MNSGWKVPLSVEEKERLLKRKATELAPQFNLKPEWIEFGFHNEKPFINFNCGNDHYGDVMDFLGELETQLPGFLDLN